MAVCGVGWLALAAAPADARGVALFAAMLFCFGVGAVLIFINFLGIRQAVTPPSLLGRMAKLLFAHRVESVSVASYVFLGWMPIIAIPVLWRSAPTGAIGSMIAGGACKCGNS